jgi:hypothetical protein
VDGVEEDGAWTSFRIGGAAIDACPQQSRSWVGNPAMPTAITEERWDTETEIEDVADRTTGNTYV